MKVVGKNPYNALVNDKKVTILFVRSEKYLTFAPSKVRNMSYSKINIVVKNPSKQLEECIRKAGQEKYERMQQALRDWKSGRYKDAEVILVK